MKGGVGYWTVLYYQPYFSLFPHFLLICYPYIFYIFNLLMFMSLFLAAGACLS